MKLFISPHNDDETLFGAYTLFEEKPHVLVVFDSYIQPERGAVGCDWSTRRHETRRAMNWLGVPPENLHCLGLHDNRSDFDAAAVLAALEAWRDFNRPIIVGNFTRVWAPVWRATGHHQHNLVAAAALTFAQGSTLTKYLTYTRDAGKDRDGREFIPGPDAVIAKHRALAEYRSQITIDNCREHFTRDLREYVI